MILVAEVVEARQRLADEGFEWITTAELQDGSGMLWLYRKGDSQRIVLATRNGDKPTVFISEEVA